MPDGGTLKQRAWAHILEANEFFDGEREFIRSAQGSFSDLWRSNRPSIATIWRWNEKRTDESREFPTYIEAWEWVDTAILSDESVYGGAVYSIDKRKSQD